MQVHFGVELLRAEWTAAVACIGTFDGVHLGHREVIRQAVSIARNREQPSILVTFDRHPAHVLAPHKCPKAIASLQSNLANFAELGVAVSIILPFDQQLSQTTAADFFERVLLDKIRASAVVVGYDFGFGFKREGDPEWLSQRIETTVVPAFEIAGLRVSSSAIRELIAKGEMGEVRSLLGRDFEVTGVVVPGQKLGRTLGYPTINLARSFDQVLPPDGVYAGYAVTDRGDFQAAISIGTRPTLEGQPRAIEAYLLDYSRGDLYGTSVTLKMSKKVRPQLRFDSLDELKSQIAEDVSVVAQLST